MYFGGLEVCSWCQMLNFFKFKNHFNKYWACLEIQFNWKADLTRTANNIVMLPHRERLRLIRVWFDNQRQCV